MRAPRSCDALTRLFHTSPVHTSLLGLAHSAYQQQLSLQTVEWQPMVQACACVAVPHSS